MKTEELIQHYFNGVMSNLDCGDNSCYWKKSGGMRTNGGCRCFRDLKQGLRLSLTGLLRALEEKYDTTSNT